ncbi:MAG: hypothetical protein M3345_03400 [Actinomycetota bacterium]|nr:hypothetical protein [Actinomycetota bacterium]
MTAISIEELRAEGLCDNSAEGHLTSKGRDLMHALEDVNTHEALDLNEAAADLVLSTNGLFR